MRPKDTTIRCGVTQVLSGTEASKTSSALGFEAHPHWYDGGENVTMSEQVQSIVEAARSLTAAQRRELMEALAAIETARPPAAAGRQELVQAIKGKYRDVPTSSESFMSRKREDLALEFRP